MLGTWHGHLPLRAKAGRARQEGSQRTLTVTRGQVGWFVYLGQCSSRRSPKKPDKDEVSSLVARRP